SLYRDQAGISLSLAGSGDFSWDAKLAEWRALARDSRERALLDNNLRWLAKLSLVPDAVPPAEEFSALLNSFQPSRAYHANPGTAWLPNFLRTTAGMLGDWLPEWLEPWRDARVSPSLRDMAMNLDFQSLALIVSDLAPPSGLTGWEFPAFKPAGPDAGLAGYLAAGPEDGNWCFQVFRRLYETLHPGNSRAAPAEVWLAAAGEVASRLEFERKIPGGGGFGALARRELAREIEALPALAACGLYRVFPPGGEGGDLGNGFPGWEKRWNRDASLELRLTDAVSGRLIAGAEREMRPLAPLREAAINQLSPLAPMVLLAHISAREAGLARAKAEATEKSPPVVPPSSEPAAAVPEADGKKAEPETAADSEAAEREVAARAGIAGKLRKRIGDLENSLRQAGIVRDAARLRLETARDREKRLNAEAIAARARADRLSERYDAAAIGAEAKKEGIFLDQARLLKIRDAVFERLARLLEYCSEEHPFVKRSRRELAAIEALIADKEKNAGPAREAGLEDIRLGSLKLEWETAAAAAAADGLEERRRRQTAEVEASLAAVTPAEEELADLEARLSATREELMALLALPKPIQPAGTEKASRSSPAPAAPAPESPPAAAPEPSPVFAALPENLKEEIIRPDWQSLAHGLALGLVFGLLWATGREMLTRRFSDAFEARRLTGLPLLLTLPAYDAAAMRRAAKTLEGRLRGSRPGRLSFIPAPLNLREPGPVARRGKLTPARHFPKILFLACGAIFIAAAVMLHQAALAGFFQADRHLRELAPLKEVVAHIPDLSEAEEGGWGDKP
ncbi:MAG: hypothetical protein LBU23_01110, partial [Planctomycetota bacterium]|nr:hypothetical protein [Planctomycetota bacterium]